MAGGRPTIYKEEYCEELIDHMEMGFSFESFGGKIGVCFRTLYNWEKEHDEFLQAKKQGLSGNLYYKERIGQRIMTTGTGNATAWIFEMKNRFPQLYRDKQEHDHTTKGEKMQAVQFVVKAQDGTNDSE